MLHYRLIPSEHSNTFVVFLHEGLGCIKMWGDYPDLVCSTLKCNGLVYDRSGYGKSNGDLTQRKADYLHVAADELYDLLHHLNLQSKQIVLYGHSDGGSIALIFASKYPELCPAIITEAAHVFVEEETLKGIKPAVKAFENGKLNGLKKYHGDRFEEVFYAWVDIWNHPSFKDWNIESELTDVTCPQLIIQGIDDQYGTLKQVETIENITAGKTTVFTPSHCGHSPFKEQQKEVLGQVVSFLQSNIKL